MGRIVEAIDAGGGRFLLYGATGSGKTEVYLQACAAALERGLGAIVLVPEIALTPQALGRFRGRFGDRVAVLHSGLTEAERRDERERIAAGEARVVVGARSAVFAPVRGLGLICVDEEHDASYKQESDPRYDARTVAAKRAALEGAVASSTGARRRGRRAGSRSIGSSSAAGSAGALPPVRVVDLRREAGYPLSAPLLAELGKVAERAGRRSSCSTGAASRLRSTAGRAASPGAARAATSRSFSTRDRRAPLPPLRARGAVAGALSRVRVVRARADRRRDAAAGARAGGAGSRAGADPARRGHARPACAALERFAAADRAVLLGTQMVAKGHHFEGVSLAAVVDADTGLALPDFRAEERTFQLLTQLAGRSGRDAPGKVLIQTFQPDARPIELAARHDVERFLAGELERRRELGYPPFRHLVRVVVSGPRRRDADACADRAEGRARRGGRARARADAPPPRPSPRAARREDRPAGRARRAGGPGARGRRAGDAEGRVVGSRRRGSPERLNSKGV